MLENSSAQVLQRPGIGLDRALRIGLTAIAQVDAASDIVPRQRHALAHLPWIEVVDLITQAAADLGHAPVVLQVIVCGGEDHPLAAVFGGVAQQFFHLRPQALLLMEQRAVIVRGAAAVAPGRLPADDALVQHQDFDARARQPPGGGKPGDPGPDHDHRKAGLLVTSHAQPSPPRIPADNASRSVPISS